jgi:hypothetical protein
VADDRTIVNEKCIGNPAKSIERFMLIRTDGFVRKITAGCNNGKS